MPDGTRGRGEGELPPDPWAGLADTPASPIPPPPPSYGASFADHPSVTHGTPAGHRSPQRRTLWHHPAVWVAVVILAGVLLVGALLEPSPSSPNEPSPDAVTAAGSTAGAAAVWAPDQAR